MSRYIRLVDTSQPPRFLLVSKVVTFHSSSFTASKKSAHRTDLTFLDIQPVGIGPTQRLSPRTCHYLTVAWLIVVSHHATRRFKSVQSLDLLINRLASDKCAYPESNRNHDRSSLNHVALSKAPTVELYALCVSPEPAAVRNDGFIRKRIRQ